MSASNARVGEGQPLGLALDEPHALRQAELGEALGGRGEHGRALVDAGHAAAVLEHQLGGDGARAGGDVEHVVLGPHRKAPHEEAVPARLLPQAEQGGAARVGGPGESGEEVQRLGLGRPSAALGAQ